MFDTLSGLILFLIGFIRVPGETGIVKGESTVATVSAGLHITLPVFDRTSSSSTTSATPKSRSLAFEDAYVRNLAISHDQYQASYTAFQSKAAAIKDIKKQQLILQIQDRLGTLNGRRLGWYERALLAMSILLDKASSQSATEAQKKAVLSADTAIKSAMTAVSKQAGSTYVIAISTDARLKTDADSIRKQLAADIMVVDLAYRNAYTQLQTAIRTFEPVSSPSSTPTGTPGKTTTVSPTTRVTPMPTARVTVKPTTVLTKGTSNL